MRQGAPADMFFKRNGKGIVGAATPEKNASDHRLTSRVRRTGNCRAEKGKSCHAIYRIPAGCKAALHGVGGHWGHRFNTHGYITGWMLISLYMRSKAYYTLNTFRWC
ncbi:MAG: hypothetical protein WCD42_04300 [Rhizomicrobium sp.]